MTTEEIKKRVEQLRAEVAQGGYECLAHDLSGILHEWHIIKDYLLNPSLGEEAKTDG